MRDKIKAWVLAPAGTFDWLLFSASVSTTSGVVFALVVKGVTHG